MLIIKKFENLSDFSDYAAQHPTIIQNWRKGNRFTWRRILVVRTDQDAAVIFSENLLVRIYAWVRNGFRGFGDYYAKKLGAKKVQFLEPSMLTPKDRKTSHIAREALKPPQKQAEQPVQAAPPLPVAQQPQAAAVPRPEVVPQPVPQPAAALAQEQQDVLANKVLLERAQKAMEKANQLTTEEKLKELDWIINKVTADQKQYGSSELSNILKTIQAAKNLVANAQQWEDYAVRIQNSRKKPPTDALTPAQINDVVYQRLGIISHADKNDLAPILRNFGLTFVSGLLAARELAQEKEYLKYAVSGDDICLEGRAKSVGVWIENTVFNSIPIEVDPGVDNYMQATFGYVTALKRHN